MYVHYKMTLFIFQLQKIFYIYPFFSQVFGRLTDRLFKDNIQVMTRSRNLRHILRQGRRILHYDLFGSILLTRKLMKTRVHNQIHLIRYSRRPRISPLLFFASDPSIIPLSSRIGTSYPTLNFPSSQLLTTNPLPFYELLQVFVV